MTTGGNRRNGRKASCEPCRLAKIRCDHDQPVCGRCSRRGMPAACFYHPAPMTKTPGSSNRSPDVAEAGSPSSPPRTQRLTSATVHLTQRRGSPAYASSGPSGTADDDAGKLQIVAAALMEARADYDLIDKVSREHHRLRAGLVPGLLISAFVKSLPELFDLDGAHNDRGSFDAIHLAKKILENTRSGFKPTVGLTVQDFISASCGKNMRVQGLGLICSMIARMVMHGLARDGQEHGNFINIMYDRSTALLLLARDITPWIDDILLWLGFENIMFVRALKYDTYLLVSRRLGDLTTDIFALGLHRETFLQAGAPFFLAELRRKAFAKCAHLDKTVAAFSDIPPRMTRRYTDIRLPLDLSDTEVLYEGQDLEKARSRLTSDGWNTVPNYQSSAWARMRYTLCIWREQILACSYHPRPLSTQHESELRALSARGMEIWESFPVHLRYTKDCWTLDLDTGICSMLALVYLSWLYCDFQIHRWLEHSDGSFYIAATMLATVLQFGGTRYSSYDKVDYEFIVLWYGMPSAAVLTSLLASSMRGQSGPSRPIPTGLNRAEIIRNLSVFVSHLEFVFPSDNANRASAMQASATITRTLDDVLNSPSTVEDSAQGSVGLLTPQGMDMSGDLGAAAFGDPMLNFLDEQGLQDWMGSIDWTAASSGWGAL